MDEIHTLSPAHFPALLREINDPPKRLYLRGALPDESLKFLCVVGSRRYSEYGKQVCQNLIEGLAGAPMVIISGLALGIDSIAHQAALDVGLPSVAIPGSGLGWDVLYPRNHVPLARDILAGGGALLSEFEPDFKATPWSFPQRNRIMAGLSHAVLVIEATEKSGTLITARLATEYNRDVFVVPGSIFSAGSRGSNQLLRMGATPITSSAEILDELNLTPSDNATTQERLFENLSEDEKKIAELLREPTSRDALIQKLGFPTHKTNMLLSALELKGVIVEMLGEIRLKQ